MSERRSKEQVFDFNMRIDPKALTRENAQQITDAIAKAVAAEVAAGQEIGDLSEIKTGFHIRLGGSHSRVFSKTAEHKRVEHSKVVVIAEK